MLLFLNCLKAVLGALVHEVWRYGTPTSCNYMLQKHCWASRCHKVIWKSSLDFADNTLHDSKVLVHESWQGRARRCKTTSWQSVTQKLTLLSFENILERHSWLIVHESFSVLDSSLSGLFGAVLLLQPLSPHERLQSDLDQHAPSNCILPPQCTVYLLELNHL